MNIVILSANPNLYSTERLIEECIKRKHNVRVINHTTCDLVIEKKKPRREAK